MSIEDPDSKTLKGRPPTAEEQFYLEAAYKDPVESIGRIEDTAKFLVGAVSATSGIFAAALKITAAAPADAKPLWFLQFLLWAASVMLLLLVLFPRSYATAQNEPAAWKNAFLRARTVKYRWLVAGASCFVLGLVLAAILSCI